ncbi:MAG: hypothetical protein ONB46_02500 [candidate division KSB1 bacterium]|nr:hypothetical protein [candidate division KSB1 bacterium]MDZ7364895.1 hypothetical protein [candidate division KSB1 bacterium]MDZ7402997.1 hypothetical protein [candidate division KSB1 bacterium]
MVDINLMGEEENREERQPQESFTQTVNLDLGDTADEEGAAPFINDPPPPSPYSREAMAPPGGYSTRPLAMNASAKSGSSRWTAYLLASVLVVAAIVGIYLTLFKTGQQQDTATAPGADFGLSTPGDSLPNVPAPDNPPAPPSETEPMPPVAGSVWSTTRIGAYTVGALGQSFSGDNDFALISYSGSNNSFLVQFLAPSPEAINEVTQAMQRNASPQELRTVSKLPAGNGGTMNNVLVLGRVSEQAAMMGPPGQRRMSFTEFSTWLKKLGADNGLRSTLYEIGKAYAADGGTRTPVQANFSGGKSGAFDFLRSLADAGPNISMSKIIVSPADRKSSSSAQVNVVLLFDFVE